MPSLDVAINALRAEVGSKKFDKAVNKIQRGATRVDRSIKRNDASLSKFGTSVKSAAGGLLTLAAAYKGLSIVKSAVKEQILFQQQLANVNTMLTEQTGHLLPTYAIQISDLAVEFGQTTETLSKGLYDILSASVDSAEAIGVLAVASKAAIGGLTTTAVAADALTTVMNAYGMEAQDAAKISDILFATVKGGKITFGELASSIGKVAAIAATAGLDFEQVSATIATMTRAGIKSDMAMTSLKGIITTFLSPQKENIEMAKQYGLILNTNTLQTIGLTGVMEKLKDATAEDTAAIFSNVRALLGASATRKAVEGLVGDYENALNSAGKAEEAYQKNAATTAFQLERTKELWKSIKRDLGEGIMPEVDTWLLGTQLLVKEWKEAWGEMDEAQKRAQDSIDKRMGNWQYLRIIPAFSLLEAGVKKVAGELVELNDVALHEADIGMESLNRTVDDLEKGYESLGKTLDTIGGKNKLSTAVDIEETTTEKRIPLSDEQKEARNKFQDLFKELTNERELLGLTNDERERAIKLTEFETQAKIALGDKSGMLVDLYKDELVQLQKAYELQEFYDVVEEGIKGVLGAPIEALLSETDSIEDVLEKRLRSLGENILNQMYEQVIMAPIMAALKAALGAAMGGGGAAGGIGGVVAGAITGSAKGNAFRNSVKMFDKGGIISQPTVFPMANGGVGLAGEAGDEGIFPLGRDAQGRLGVRGAGGEEKQPLKIINVVDQSMYEEYLNSASGERVVMNIMNRNKGAGDAFV